MKQFANRNVGHPYLFSSAVCADGFSYILWEARISEIGLEVYINLPMDTLQLFPANPIQNVWLAFLRADFTPIFLGLITN